MTNTEATKAEETDIDRAKKLVDLLIADGFNLWLFPEDDTSSPMHKCTQDAEAVKNDINACDMMMLQACKGPIGARFILVFGNGDDGPISDYTSNPMADHYYEQVMGHLLQPNYLPRKDTGMNETTETTENTKKVVQFSRRVVGDEVDLWMNVALTQPDADRIRFLAGKVVELGVLGISEFYGLPEFFELAYDDEAGEECAGEQVRVEGVTLHVYDDCVEWTCYRKNGDIRYRSELIDLADIFSEFGLDPLPKKGA